MTKKRIKKRIKIIFSLLNGVRKRTIINEQIRKKSNIKISSEPLFNNIERRESFSI